MYVVGSGDLTDQRCIIDRRVLDWIVGLDSEINEIVEGSDLYEPKVNLKQVSTRLDWTILIIYIIITIYFIKYVIAFITIIIKCCYFSWFCLKRNYYLF